MRGGRDGRGSLSWQGSGPLNTNGSLSTNVSSPQPSALDPAEEQLKEENLKQTVRALVRQAMDNGGLLQLQRMARRLPGQSPRQVTHGPAASDPAASSDEPRGSTKAQAGAISPSNRPMGQAGDRARMDSKDAAGNLGVEEVGNSPGSLDPLPPDGLHHKTQRQQSAAQRSAAPPAFQREAGHGDESLASAAAYDSLAHSPLGEAPTSDLDLDDGHRSVMQERGRDDLARTPGASACGRVSSGKENAARANSGEHKSDLGGEGEKKARETTSACDMSGDGEDRRLGGHTCSRAAHHDAASGEPEQQGAAGRPSSLRHPDLERLIADDKSADHYHSKGYAHRKKGEFETAIFNYSVAMGKDPKHFKALFNRGFSHDKLANFDAAIADYTAAIRLDPNNAFAYYNRGISYDRKGDLKLAIDNFTKAIELEANNADFYHNRGFSNRKLGRYAAATQDYTAALRLNNKHFKAYYNRAFAQDKLGQ